jgi:hypothetical protein
LWSVFQSRFTLTVSDPTKYPPDILCNQYDLNRYLKTFRCDRRAGYVPQLLLRPDFRGSQSGHTRNKTVNRRQTHQIY